jgi:LysW-gamma-L-alpha-aminoadipyl-6-phosphate/LysW-L-glutamyl-5-phosphate reductase
MAKRFKAALVGGSGYGGGEIARRLLMHPDVELVRVASIDHVGEPLSNVHPNLEGRTSLCFEELSPEAAAQGMDVVLLGLPHKVSATKMPGLLASGAKIVDLSGDFRLRDAALYEKYYHAKHPCPEHLTNGTFVYGLPELNRDAIRQARAVASPGCFATTMELALLPLAKAGLLHGPVDVVGITGSSGSGIAPAAGTHHPVRAVNLKTYKPLSHQHLPEVLQTLGDATLGIPRTEAGGPYQVDLRFVPVSAPLSRGIFVTAFVQVAGDTTAEQLHALYREAYAPEPFVRVPAKRLPEVVAVSGTNYAEVGIEVGEVGAQGTRTVATFCATDNLIKGGAGQAIQSTNLLLGLDERLTLEDPGGYP